MRIKLKDVNNVGNKLYEFRKEYGVPMREMVELTGLSMQTLFNVENGRTTPNANTTKIILNVIEKAKELGGQNE